MSQGITTIEDLFVKSKNFDTKKEVVPLDNYKNYISCDKEQMKIDEERAKIQKLKSQDHELVNKYKNNKMNMHAPYVNSNISNILNNQVKLNKNINKEMPNQSYMLNFLKKKKDSEITEDDEEQDRKDYKESLNRPFMSELKNKTAGTIPTSNVNENTNNNNSISNNKLFSISEENNLHLTKEKMLSLYNQGVTNNKSHKYYNNTNDSTKTDSNKYLNSMDRPYMSDYFNSSSNRSHNMSKLYPSQKRYPNCRNIADLKKETERQREMLNNLNSNQNQNQNPNSNSNSNSNVNNGRIPDISGMKRVEVKKEDGAFLFETFGEENIQRAREEMQVINKNRKLQDLLVNTKSKSNLDLDFPEDINEISALNKARGTINLDDSEMLDGHINPVRQALRSEEEDFYRYFKFAKEDIFEKTLDLDFYKFKLKSNTGDDEHSIIPDKFINYNHFKYIWINSFFYELKHSLLSGKVENSEKQKYVDANLKMTLLNRKEIINSNISIYNTNSNKKLDFVKAKIFKENDIFAIYNEEEIKQWIKDAKNVTYGKYFKENNHYSENQEGEHINFTKLDFNFENKKGMPFFLGILSYDKNLNTNRSEMNFKIHSKNETHINSNGNCYYSVQLLGNLTTSLREYLSLIDMDSWSISEALINPGIFYHTKKLNNLIASQISEKTKKYLNSISNSDSFNESQKAAINKISLMNNNKDVFLIQGPPGTGKTHTIIGILSLIYIQNPEAKILICAPSNAAIDEISLRIAKGGLYTEHLTNFKPEFIRFGLYDRIDKESKELNSENAKFLQNYSLEKLIDNKFKQKEKSLSVELDKISFILEQFETEKSVYDKLCNKKLNELLVYGVLYNKSELAKKISQNNEDYKQLVNDRKNFTLEKKNNTNLKKLYERELIEKTRIICTTLNSAGNERLKSQNVAFEYVIIDEACQCVEPSSIIPFSLGVKKLIMVGDHMQLPATVFSDKATQTKYNRSLFERMIDNNYPRHVLTIQYRMEANIREFIGKTFYEDKLQDDSNTMSKLVNSSFYEIVNRKYNFSFFDLKYSKEKQLVSKSYVNDKEVEFVVSLLRNIQDSVNKYNSKLNEKSLEFFGNFSFNPNFNKGEVYLKYAIISPYKAQVRALTDAIFSKCSDMKQYVEVNTVDSFQGREQDIVIISTVRSKNDTNGTGIGFLNDYRRMNVALSRARLGCFIVGDASTLIQNEYWQKLIDHCCTKSAIFPIRENYIKDKSLVMSLIQNGCVRRNKEYEDGEVRMNNSNLQSIIMSDNRGGMINEYNKDLCQIRNLNSKYKKLFSNDGKQCENNNALEMNENDGEENHKLLGRKIKSGDNDINRPNCYNNNKDKEEVPELKKDIRDKKSWKRKNKKTHYIQERNNNFNV